MRYPKPYVPVGRRGYYFVYRDGRGVRHIRSTGCDRVGEAHDYVRAFIDARTARRGSMSFEEYQRPFFSPQTCPRYARMKDAGQSVGLFHLANQRRWLDLWILADKAFCRKRMNTITRGDLLDLRSRVRERLRMESPRAVSGGLNTVNKAIATVGVVLAEAYFREDIPANPAAKLGEIHYERVEPDIFTLEELGRLTSRDPLAREVFRLAALTGMRCAELIGLHCRQLVGDVLTVDSALKDRKRMGLPKWDKVRIITLAREARQIIEGRGASSGLVFTREDGRRLTHGWWRDAFIKALGESDITIGERRLVPHSLRHSLNTHLLEAGVDPLRIQLYLWGKRATAAAQGTSSGITQVQSRYSHFQGAMTEPVARAIERLYCHDVQKKAVSTG